MHKSTPITATKTKISYYNATRHCNNTISIYIHWPFCLSKCPYCDFNSHVSATVDHGLWLKCYEKEIDYFKGYIDKKYISSIFFGGGTPSLMNPSIVYGIITKLNKIGIIDNNTEITLEANPTSFETEKFKQFKEAGVNRISIGIQSLINKDLKVLGRNHDANQAINAITQASDIFSRISFDLIYARQGQSLNSWEIELKTALKLAKGHISLYQLTIEKGTKFYKLHKEGLLNLPTQEQSAEMYEWTGYYLETLGYERYEISNYAKQGHESKHNLAYWNYESYLGIGPGAHSRIHDNNKIKSLTMQYSPINWINSIQTQGHAILNSTYLTVQQIIQEIFIMGLRLKAGISNDKLKELTGYYINQVINQRTALQYQENKLLILEKNNIKLASQGLILYDYIIPRLLDF